MKDPGEIAADALIEIGNVVGKAVRKAVRAERERCTKALCDGCAAGEKIVVVNGDWMHPHYGLPSRSPCAAQVIREPE